MDSPKSSTPTDTGQILIGLWIDTIMYNDNIFTMQTSESIYDCYLVKVVC